MKLHRYNQFLGLQPLNENLDKSKKFLKERFLLKKAAEELDLLSDELKSQFEYGDKKTLTLKDFSPEDQQKLRLKLREMRVSDEEARELERDPDFVKLREMIKDNIGYLYNFVYMHFVEMVPFDGAGGIQDLYKRVLENRAVLDRLPKKFDINFIDPTLPNEKETRNNAEILEDGLDKLGDYKLVQKVLETLPKKLKKEYNEAPELVKQQVETIAKGFEEISADKKEKVWKTFFGEMRLDTRPVKADGSPNPNYNKMVYMSSLMRFVNMDNSLKEFIKAALNHLESSQNEGYADRIEKINLANEKFGNLGAPIVYDNKGILVIEVKSFPCNQFLNGHTSHCIKDSMYQWNHYVGSHNNKQYYIYNFNISSFDVSSTIGVTIEPGQRIRAAHNKPDHSVSSSIKSILKGWEKEYGIEDDIWSYLKPMTQEEIQKRERAKIAEREIVRKGLSIDQIKQYVKEDGADINKDNAKALINAVEEDNLEKTKYVLSLGALPNLAKGSDSAISKAKNLDMIKLLVSYGSDITGDVFNTIMHDDAALEFCLKAGLDPNFGSSMPFRKVCKGSYKNREDIGESYLDAFKLLLKYGGQLNDQRGRCMIIKWASEYARIDILEYLDEIGKTKEFKESDWKEAIQWLDHARKINEKSRSEIVAYLQSKIKS